MKLIINKDRSVIPVGTWGTVNENDYEILDFEFPEELEEYNKRIVYYLGDERVWDTIVDNKAYITNAITTKGSVKAYVWLTKENTEREADTDFRTQLFEMQFYENENADGIVPTPEQVDGFNTMLTAMNNKITEIDTLETAIEGAESDRVLAEQGRVNAENTRVSNENTRQSNEQTRQSQEADRERRTNEAIENIEDKTAEYNQNAEEKTEAFNTNATQKTNDFNSNYTQKVNDFNTNASSKTSDFNSNAETKTNTFNTNATNKTNAFNSNATEKTTAFNNNATSKTTDFNTNAENKTSAFNDNATQKTTNFDNNASDKTTDFNNNAQAKIDEYDEHIVDYQAQIDELQEEVEELSENMPWNTTEQATEISVDDAAKYSRNKLELFGNTEQTQYTGVQLFDENILSQESNYNAYDSATQLWTTNSGGGYGRSILYNATGYANRNIEKLVPLTSAGTYTLKFYDFVNDTGYASAIELALFDNDGLKISQTTQNSNFIKFTIDNSCYMDLCRRNNSGTMSFSKIMMVKGDYTEDTFPDYEPYVGGVPAPNPDYPQPIHVVSGANAVEVHSKNWFDGNFIFGEWSIVDANFATKNDRICCKDYIKVLPGFTYTISYINSGTTYLLEFDENKQYLNKYTRVTYRSLNGTITLGETTHYIKFYCIPVDQSKISVNEQCQLEIGLIATEYQKYYHADYPINLGSIELCKIGNYQDEFFKNELNNPHYDSSLTENGWYKNEIIKKFLFKNAPNESWGTWREDLHEYQIQTDIQDSRPNGTWVSALCDKLKNVSVPGTQMKDNEFSAFSSRLTGVTNYLYFRFKKDPIDNLDDFKIFVENNNLLVYTILDKPVPVQITDTTLISQLDAIYEHLKLVKGTNNITITPSDLAPYVTLNYMQDLPSKLDNLDSRLSLLE